MAKKPFTEKEIQRMDRFWTKTPGGAPRVAFDKHGLTIFHSLKSLIFYLSERARYSEAFRQEFMDMPIPSDWLQASLYLDDSEIPPEEQYLRIKLLVQRTAEKLKGN